MKIIVILSIIIITILLTINYIKKVRLHTKAISQCVLMIEKIEILLSYNNLSVNEIFNILSSDKTYYLLSFINEISKNLLYDDNSYILNSCNISFINNNKYLNKEDKDTLINFFSILGKSDINGQIINCKTYKDIFKKKLKDNEIRESSDCKSSGMLILGIGFFIVILLI